MKAAVWHGPEDLRVEEVQEPVQAPNEVKVSVAWCGISGTDVHEYESGPIMIPVEPHPLTGKRPPVVMGHELAGTVVEVGSDVEAYAPGDPVTANSIITCGACANCLAGLRNLCARIGVIGLAADGAFASFVCIPEESLHPLPPGFDLAWGALLEPLSTGMHAARQGRVALGDRVGVIGCGPIGMGAIQAALAAGASEVLAIDPVDFRRDLAEKLGAHAVDPADGEGIAAAQGSLDVVINCARPDQTAAIGLGLLRSRGRQIVVGLSFGEAALDLNLLLMGETEVIGSAGRLHREDYPALIALMQRGVIDAEAMITSRISLDDIVEEGFEAMRKHRERELKILVSPSPA